MNKNEIITILKNTKNDFDINQFVLFGSVSTNTNHKNSDIDIAFLTDNDIDSYECFMKAQELADIFKRDVDLINLNTSSTVFKAQVVGTGKRIYCSDDTKRMYFEMRTFKSYAMLNEEREVTLKKIKERGTVYRKRCDS